MGHGIGEGFNLVPVQSLLLAEDCLVVLQSHGSQLLEVLCVRTTPTATKLQFIGVFTCNQ